MTRTILLIEADPDILEIITHVLEERGYKVLTGRTTDDLDQIYTQQAELILIDEWQREQAGQQLCRRIKDHDELRHVPVIILSTSNAIEAIAGECGADAFIRKPFQISELLDVVDRQFKYPDN